MTLPPKKNICIYIWELSQWVRRGGGRHQEKNIFPSMHVPGILIITMHIFEYNLNVNAIQRQCIWNMNVMWICLKIYCRLQMALILLKAFIGIHYWVFTSKRCSCLFRHSSMILTWNTLKHKLMLWMATEDRCYNTFFNNNNLYWILGMATKYSYYNIV